MKSNLGETGLILAHTSRLRSTVAGKLGWLETYTASCAIATVRGRGSNCMHAWYLACFLHGPGPKVEDGAAGFRMGLLTSAKLTKTIPDRHAHRPA